MTTSASTSTIHTGIPITTNTTPSSSSSSSCANNKKSRPLPSSKSQGHAPQEQHLYPEEERSTSPAVPSIANNINNNNNNMTSTPAVVILPPPTSWFQQPNESNTHDTSTHTTNTTTTGDNNNMNISHNDGMGETNSSESQYLTNNNTLEPIHSSSHRSTAHHRHDSFNIPTQPTHHSTQEHELGTMKQPSHLQSLNTNPSLSSSSSNTTTIIQSSQHNSKPNYSSPIHSTHHHPKSTTTSNTTTITTSPPLSPPIMVKASPLSSPIHSSPTNFRNGNRKFKLKQKHSSIHSKSITNSSSSSKLHLSKTKPKTKTTKTTTTTTATTLYNLAKATSQTTHQNISLLPTAAKELISNTARRAIHYTRLGYVHVTQFHTRHSDVGLLGGYDFPNDLHGLISVGSTTTSSTTTCTGSAVGMNGIPSLPPFSNLPWIERQLVKEWRTIQDLEKQPMVQLYRILQQDRHHHRQQQSKQQQEEEEEEQQEKEHKEREEKEKGEEEERNNGNEYGNDSVEEYSSHEHERKSLYGEKLEDSNSSGVTEPVSSSSSYNLFHHDTMNNKLPKLPFMDDEGEQEFSNTTNSDDNNNDDDDDTKNLQEENDSNNDEDDTILVSPEEADNLFTQARTFAPQPHPRPPWENATTCHTCRKPFSSTLLRHHCRSCGRSYCQEHSRWTHALYHLGYDSKIGERVCAECKEQLEASNMMERITWRMSRCRDSFACVEEKEDLWVPYFDLNMDTVEDLCARVSTCTIQMVKSIPFLGAQTSIAVETLDVLRKYGLKGLYGLVLRKEFLAAAELLCRVTGINKRAWPLSVHELSAAIFYALSQHRAIRGADPEREDLIHSFRLREEEDVEKEKEEQVDVEEFADYDLALDGDLQIMVGDGVDRHSTSDNEGIKICSSESSKEHENVDEGGDTILWRIGNNYPTSTNGGIAVIDDTDKYDPMAESVVNFMAMTDKEVQEHQTKKSNNDAAVPSDMSMSFSSFKGCDGVSTPDKDYVDKCQGSDQKSNPTKTRATGGGTVGNELPFDPVCDPVPDSMLSSLIFYAPVALNFIYAQSEVDMQLLAAQQGWRLIYAHLNHEGDSTLEGQIADKPGYALFAHLEHKIACISIRGTVSINDVVTDIRAVPVQFPEPGIEQWSLTNMLLGGRGQQDDSLNKEEKEHSFDDQQDGDWTSVSGGKGLALSGMAGAAYNLFKENIDALLQFVQNGYRLRLVGHSLGGSVATLLGTLVRSHLEMKLRKGELGERFTTQSVGDKGDTTERVLKNDLLRVYGYGSPACVDAELAEYSKSFTTSVVLHDDVIPRLTPTSIRALMTHLFKIKETWVKVHLADDINAIKERAKTVWAPKVRNGFTLSSKPVEVYKKLKANKFVKKKLRRYKRKFRGDDTVSLQEASKELYAINDNTTESANQLKIPTSEDNSGLVYDGDCFYEAEESLIEHSDEENDKDKDDTDEGWLPFDEPSIAGNLNMKSASHVSCNDDEVDIKTESSPAVLLEETPLPRMFIPGNIGHIYTHRGGYKIAFVPRAFRELRRVSLAGNMLNDHMSKSYYEALVECKTIRASKDRLPEWTSYDEETTCSCCGSLFTWASTSDSEAQEARDKHNCRSCGSLVCNSCSMNRLPLPSKGILTACRVCDRCYNVMGAEDSGQMLTRSFTEDNDNVIKALQKIAINK